MKKRKHTTAPTGQKQSNVIHHNYATNSARLRGLVLNRYKTCEATFIDILNNTFLGTFREVFNAWNQVESKFFIFLNTVCNRFVHLEKNHKQSPIAHQLIPIDLKQEDVFAQIRRLKEYGK